MKIDPIKTAQLLLLIMSDKKSTDSSITTAEAGRLGGRATAAKHSRDFYAKIGREGGVAAGQRTDAEKAASVEKQLETKMSRGQIAGPRA